MEDDCRRRLLNNTLSSKSIQTSDDIINELEDTLDNMAVLDDPWQEINDIENMGWLNRERQEMNNMENTGQKW